MILSYTDYVNMDGELSEAAFCRLERLAENEINYRTFGRISLTQNIADKMKNLIFDLIPLFSDAFKQTSEGSVASVSNDGVSISYTAKTGDELKEEIDQRIETALAFEKADNGEFLLYCGVDGSCV